MQQSLSSLSIPTLRSSIKGSVIAPEDPGYDEARRVFSGRIDRHPCVIVRAADAADVARAVRLARETGLPLAVRSGGHSGAGHSTTDSGIVLDLRDMKALEVDVQGASAWAEAGLTAAEYSAGVGSHGFATGFGDTGSVGIGGITLGGGIGYLTRKYGLTIDSLLAAEIVTAESEKLHVDATSHPDLFWALRGGGGNFGVVTRFRYRLHPVDQIVGGLLMLPATPEIVTSLATASEEAPEELSAIINVMPAPPLPFVPQEHHGRLIVMILLCYAGDAEEGERAIAPFRAAATPIVDMVRPMRYPEIFPPTIPRSTRLPSDRRRSSTGSIAVSPRRSSIICNAQTPGCALPRFECSAGPWLAYRATPRLSRIATVEFWSSWRRSTTVSMIGPIAKHG